MTLYLRPKELGVKIQNKWKFCFWLEILNRKNQVAYLVLQVAFLAGNSVKTLCLACLVAEWSRGFRFTKRNRHHRCFQVKNNSILIGLSTKALQHPAGRKAVLTIPTDEALFGVQVCEKSPPRKAKKVKKKDNKIKKNPHIFGPFRDGLYFPFHLSFHILTQGHMQVRWEWGCSFTQVLLITAGRYELRPGESPRP